MLANYCYLLLKWKKEYVPKNFEESLHPLFVESLQTASVILDNQTWEENQSQSRKPFIMQSFVHFFNDYEKKNHVLLYADDCSSEALTTLLVENDGFIAVYFC